MDLRTDEEIEADVTDLLRHDTRIHADNIRVTTKDGIVRLDGTVPSYYEKEVANELAMRVKGVVTVNNELTISPPVHRADDEIADDVRDNLLRDVRIDAPGRIGVDVSSGVVTLSGIVDSFYEKFNAASDAWNVPAVANVVNNLQIQPPNPRTDEEIQADVQNQILSDPRLADPQSIEVHVHEGVVVLDGVVYSFFQRSSAEEDARLEPGVVDVIDHLVVTLP